MNTVGSYGFQLNRVLDALSLIIKSGKLELSRKETKKLKPFMDLAEAADKASKKYIKTRVDRLIKTMQSLEKTNPEQYKELRSQLRAALPKVKKRKLLNA